MVRESASALARMWPLGMANGVKLGNIMVGAVDRGTPEGGTPSMSQLLTLRSIVCRASLGLALLAALGVGPPAAMAQDPVGELKKELLDRPYVDAFLPAEKRQEALKKAYDERELKLGKLIDGRLNSFPE